MNPYQKPLTVLQSIAVTFMAIGVMILTFPIMFLEEAIGQKASFLVFYCVSMGAALLAVRAYFRRRHIGVRLNLQIPSYKIFIAILVVTPCISLGVSTPIVSLIPITDSFAKMLLEMSGTDVYSFMAIVIAAPILEELIFRGFILEGLLRKYQPAKSIIISALLFGFIHLNPWQFITASILGFFMGWIYHRTRSVGYTIFIHMANNLIAFVGGAFEETTLESLKKPLIYWYGGAWPLIVVTISAIFLGAACLYYLDKRLPVFNRTVDDNPDNKFVATSDVASQNEMANPQ